MYSNCMVLRKPKTHFLRLLNGFSILNKQPKYDPYPLTNIQDLLILF